MWFQDFANSLWLELQLANKPLHRQKPTAETFSDTPLPGLEIAAKISCVSNKVLRRDKTY